MGPKSRWKPNPQQFQCSVIDQRRWQNKRWSSNKPEKLSRTRQNHWSQTTADNASSVQKPPICVTWADQDDEMTKGDKNYETISECGHSADELPLSQPAKTDGTGAQGPNMYVESILENTSDRSLKFRFSWPKIRENFVKTYVIGRNLATHQMSLHSLRIPSASRSSKYGAVILDFS